MVFTSVAANMKGSMLMKNKVKRLMNKPPVSDLIRTIGQNIKSEANLTSMW